MNNLIGISDGNAPAACGVATWWKVDRAMPVEALKDAWRTYNLPDSVLPEAPTTAMALRRVLRTYAGNHVLLRSIKWGRRWALVNETVKAVDDDVLYGCDLIAGVDDGGSLEFNPPEHPLAAEITAKVEAERDYWSRDNIMAVALRMVHECAGVSLRPMGGVYFVPKGWDSEQLWRRFASAMAGFSVGTVYLMPVMSGDDATLATLDAINVEASAAADAALNALAGNLTARGIRGQIGNLDALLAKLERYDTMLQGRLGKLVGNIEEIRATAAVAMMSTPSADE